MLSRIAFKVAAMYWDPKERSSSDEKEDDDTVEVPGIASRVATEYTLALSIGKALRDLLFSGDGSMFPQNFFAIKDTHANGVKGFGSGYFSFGLEPIEWVNPSDPKMKVLASGSTMLLWGEYDPEGNIRSTKPADASQPWSGNPEIASESIIARIFAGYYNKLRGGGVKQGYPIGSILIGFDEQENASVEILNPTTFKKNIEDFIAAIQANPPPEAISQQSFPSPKPSPKPLPTFGPASRLPEYSSVEDFIDFIYEFGPDERGKYDAGGKAQQPGYVYGPADLNLLAKNTGKTKEEIRRQLDSYDLVFDPGYVLKISAARRIALSFIRP